MPIAIGIMPINPIMYVGTIRAIKEPSALMAISKPIPIYDLTPLDEPEKSMKKRTS
jgi:hypothetical protein